MTPIGGTFVQVITFISRSIGKVLSWMCNHPTPINPYTMPYSAPSLDDGLIINYPQLSAGIDMNLLYL